MIRKEDSILVEIDQCQYILWIEARFRWALARAPTRFLTHPPGIAQELQQTCPGKESHPEGRHAVLFGGHSKNAQVYSFGLPGAICRGTREQMEMDKIGQSTIATVNVNDSESVVRAGAEENPQATAQGRQPSSVRGHGCRIAASMGRRQWTRAASGKGPGRQGGRDSAHQENQFVHQGTPE